MNEVAFNVNIFRYLEKASKIQEPRLLHGQLIGRHENELAQDEDRLFCNCISATSVTTSVRVNSQALADWSSDNAPGESGNVRNYSILRFVKLFLSNGRREREKKKDEQNIKREEGKNNGKYKIKEENSGQWRSGVDTNSHRG